MGKEGRRRKSLLPGISASTAPTRSIFFSFFWFGGGGKILSLEVPHPLSEVTPTHRNNLHTRTHHFSGIFFHSSSSFPLPRPRGISRESLGGQSCQMGLGFLTGNAMELPLAVSQLLFEIIICCNFWLQCGFWPYKDGEENSSSLSKTRARTETSAGYISPSLSAL